MLEREQVEKLIGVIEDLQPNGKKTVDLSDEQKTILRSLPTIDSYHFLLGYFMGLDFGFQFFSRHVENYVLTDYPLLHSRAINAVQALDIDVVEFIRDFYLGSKRADYRALGCFHLAEIDDPRVKNILANFLLNDPDVDVRSQAAESLISVGDETTLEALQYARDHDHEVDMECYRVSKVASVAIEAIEERRRKRKIS